MDELDAILETGGIAAVELAASAMAERGENTPPCPSCGKPMIGPFCAICGQPRNTHRRSLHHLVHDFVKDIASFDSRILRTTRALLLRPGELPNAFRDGRTQPYVPAVRLYLFVSLAFFLFLSATGIGLVQFNMTATSYRLVHDAAGHVYKESNGKRELMEGFKSDVAGKVTITDTDDDDVGKIKTNMIADGRTKTDISNKLSFFHRRSATPPVPQAVLDEKLKDTNVDVEINGQKSNKLKDTITGTLKKLRADPNALNEPISTWIPRILFVLLPLFAVLLAIFFRKPRKEFFFVDHLVFSLTMHSFAFVALIGAAALAQVLSASRVASIVMIVVSIYLFLSLKFFYRQGWIKTGIKFVCISCIYFFFFLIPALVFTLVASVIWT